MSLSSTYNNVKSLLVTKLTNKGITNANTNQGMTTLINKIDDIETTIPTTLTGNVTGTYAPNVDVDLNLLLKSSFENDDDVSIDTPIRNADIGIYIDNTLEETITTDNNGLASYTLNMDEKGNYNFIAIFDESRPFASALLTGLITIFESIIKYFQNISFSHSSGGSSMSVSVTNNESLTMSVQSFEEDNTTSSIGSQVDYLIGTSLGGETEYEDIPLQTDTSYDFTGYDFDIMYSYPYSYWKEDTLVLYFDDMSIKVRSVTNDVIDGVNLIYQNTVTDRSINPFFRIKEGRFYTLNSDTLAIDKYIGEIESFSFGVTVDGFIVRKYINSNDNFNVVDTVINDNQGYSSYTYEAQGIGEIYLKAQSHDDPTIQTDPYLISDWVKKDFNSVGNWVAFTGRVNTFSSNTDTVFTQSNGSKGGVHSQNTIFHLPNNDYVVSFKINNGTIGAGVRVGLHSASYDDHHEKAVIGIENDSSGGFKFDYSTSEVTTVTKVTTGVSKLNTDDLIEFKVIDNTVTFYINGTSYGTVTLDWLHTPIWLYGQSWSTNNGNMSIKEFRVKIIEE